MLVEVLILGLAAWRIAALLSYEQGPGKIFLKLREKLGIQHLNEGVPVSWPENFLTEVLSCVWCLSLYSGILLYGLWELGLEIPIYILAISTVAIAAEKWNRE